MTVHTPIETRHSGLPPWAIGLTVFVFLVGGVYLASNLSGENPPFAIPGASAPVASGEPDPAVGEALVAQAGCASCHGADLSGQASFPSIRGVSQGPVSENLQDLAAEYPDDWVALWINGTTPETEGIDRMGMPAFGDELSPEQIAAIAAYLRSLSPS
ncbi:MAG TPA: cytochrome c [Methylomirabilota bacterium]|nr:cytochrome c [Methylomirabilota bacterium]